MHCNQCLVWFGTLQPREPGCTRYSRRCCSSIRLVKPQMALPTIEMPSRPGGGGGGRGGGGGGGGGNLVVAEGQAST